MQNIADKITGNSLTASEYTSHKNDNLNNIVTAGITPSGSDDFQGAKSVSQQVGDANYFATGGTGDAIVLNVQSPRLAPPALTNGLKARFRASATNTGAVTINVAGLGSKSVEKNGLTSALVAGDIQSGKLYEVTYILADDKFELIRISDAGATSPASVIPYGVVPNINSGDPDHDIEFSIGRTKDSSNSLFIELASSLTKQIDANWSEGNNAGGFPDSISLSPSTLYYNFIISKTDGTTDAGFDSDPNATNLLDGTNAGALGYVNYKKRGGFYTDGASNIVGFVADEIAGNGIRFRYDNRVQDLTTTTPSVGVRSPFTLTVPPNTRALINAMVLDNDVSAENINITEENQVDIAPALGNSTISGTNTGIGQIEAYIKTNSSSQIYQRGTDGGISAFNVYTLGYIDEGVD